jgi:hypothetical protein
MPETKLVPAPNEEELSGPQIEPDSVDFRPATFRLHKEKKSMSPISLPA